MKSTNLDDSIVRPSANDDETRQKIYERIGILFVAIALVLIGIILIGEKEDPAEFIAAPEPIEGKTEQAVKSVDTISDKININKASVEDLDRLPGIGEILAQRIIDYREKNGGFKKIEEIKDVSGIGDAKYNNIKDKISI